MKFTLPHEISASIVAFATVFLTMSPFFMPTWAIFITWAGTFLLGGPSRENATKMVIATTTGTAFGVVALYLNNTISPHIGGGTFGKTLTLAVIIFAVNASLLTTGRLPLFSLIPGMFFGFASVTATYVGGFGFDSGNLAAAAISSAAMSALGPLAAYLGVRLMSVRAPRLETVETSPAA